MMFYEYKCLDCSARFQEHISSPYVNCPGCNSERTEKIWIDVSKNSNMSNNKCKQCEKCGNKCSGIAR